MPRPPLRGPAPGPATAFAARSHQDDSPTLPLDSAVDPVIVVDRVSRRYGTTLAVRDLSFTVPRGQVLGFLGPNGAGKTTTMRMLTGFMPPSSGRVLVAGHDLAEAPVEARRQIGYLPENPPLYPEMDVRGYLEFAARLRGVPRPQMRAAVDRAIERCALGEARERIVGRLSRGYRQRVGLAQALVHDPAVLVLDEPTAGLDPKQIHETRRLVRDLAGERTVVLSTHILPEVEMTCDRVVIISRGRLRAEDTPEALAARAGAARTVGAIVEIEAAPGRGADDFGDLVAALGTAPGAGGVTRGPATPEGSCVLRVETEASAEARSALARVVLERGFLLLGLRRAEASLEQVFLELTTEESAEPNADAAAPPPEASP